ncbi:MAG: CopG family transcriptional regulator [Sulfuricurvum sp.]|nr:CopG family transcriptional regulator [Sulfuricurvum sp.]
MSVRTTITLDEDILKLLKLKALETSESLSSLVNNIVIDALREDNMDLKAFEERKNEETLSFESFLKQLEANGKL